MSSTIDFLIRLKDMMTQPLRNVARVSQSTANQIQNSLNNLRPPRQFANSLDDLRRRLDAVYQRRDSTTIVSVFRDAQREAASLERQIARMENRYTSSAGSKIAGFLKSQVMGYLTAGSVLAFGISSLGKAMDFEVKNKTFEVLTGSKTKGAQLSNDLLQLKQNTILGTSVYQNAQTLMGFGIGENEVVKDLRMIGDVAMGNTDRMASLTLAFSQTRAAGRLMGQDLLQYINAGFNPLGVISQNWKEFGLKAPATVGQLKVMMEKGQISAKAVTHAFEVATSSGGRFYGMMDSIATTTSGKLSLLKGHFAAFQISVGQQLQPLTNSLLDMANSFFHALSNGKTVADQMGDQITKIRTLQLELTNTNTSQARRLELMKQLHDINPELTKGINAESIEYSKLANNINNVVSALNQKRIADNIERGGAATIKRYNTAIATSGETEAQMAQLLVEIDPSLAARNDMSFGQKQMYAMKLLRDKISKGKTQTVEYNTNGVSGGIMGGGGVSMSAVKEQEQLNRMINLINTNAKANSTVKDLNQSVNKIKSDIQIATNLYSKILNPSPGKTTGATGKGGTGTGGPVTGMGGTATSNANDYITESTKKINEGGQRSINITIGKQIETINLHVMGKEEAGMEVTQIIHEQLIRALQSLNGNKDGGI